MRTLKIEIYGRVQGVLFRDNAKKFADDLKLKGFVRNRRDGSVLIVAQGSEEKLKKLVSWIESSPGFAKVIDMKVVSSDAKILYKDFKVIHKGGVIVDKSKAFFSLGKFIFGMEKGKIPVHVVIIPDGNRRWAREKGLIASVGHYSAGSYDNIESIFDEGRKLGIKYMSIWAFSTENWGRDKREIKAVFDVVMGGVERFRRDAHKNKIRFRHIGRKDRIPKKLAVELRKLEEETEDYGDFSVQLCFDYGGRDEILRAINRMLKSGKKKINEEEFRKNLDTSGIPDPDLIIRTSGEKRTSGFMPFQSAYAELYFIEKYFPDFNRNDLRKAVSEYSKRVRRFGGTNKKDLKNGRS